MTDRLLETLAHLDAPAVDDVRPERAVDPGRLADGALRRAGRRARARRLATAVGAPLIAAAAVVAVSTAPVGQDAGRWLHEVATQPTAADRPAPWGAAPRVGVLLLGSDAGPNREGWRADSVVLASIDTRTGDTLLVGVPRNRLGVTRPDGRFEIGPDPRVAPIEPQVERLTGVRVDATVRLDMAGLARVVDTLGGVEVTVRERLAIGGSAASSDGDAEQPEAWLEPGRQRLRGYAALWYARSRYDSDDYARMRRQRCLLGAMVAQTDTRGLVTTGPRLLSSLGDHLQTTIDLADLPAWLELLGKVRTAQARTLLLALPPTAGGVPDYDASVAAVRQALSTPPGTAPATGATTGSGASGRGGSGEPDAGVLFTLTDVC